MLVKDLSFEAHHRMDVLLLPLNSGRDWKTLADKMGYSHEEIRYLESKREPVKELIRDYESKGRTVSELLSLLREMERQDLIDDLQEYIESAAKEKEKVVSEMQQTCAVLNKEIKTLCESYDVFICYAGPDKPFAEELVKTLEGQPYCMKVCIDYRDFLSPGDHLETAAEAIEERCRKVLLILSENFHRCHVADFQAKIALSLSIEARKRILIPILYKPCKIPTMLKFIYYVDYTTEDARKYFWKKLVASLGYRNSST